MLRKLNQKRSTPLNFKMEFFTILLTSLLGLLSPTGLVVDRVAEAQIRKRLVATEELQVRIDNAPSYQIINGRVDRVRIAGRGIFPIKDFRINTFELETDPIAVQLRSGKLEKPLQAAFRIGLTEKDVNQALRSPQITARLQNVSIRFLRQREERYNLINPRVTFLRDRIRLQVDLQEKKNPQTLAIVAEAEPKAIAGKSLQLTNLRITANGQPVPESIASAIANGISDRLNLDSLERSNITARILDFKLNPAALQIVAFAQVRSK